MSDLTEQLRALARAEHGDLGVGNDAADEIESRLIEIDAVIKRRLFAEEPL